MNLLPRFVECSAGQVTLDGVSLEDWSLESLRSQFAAINIIIAIILNIILVYIVLKSSSKIEKMLGQNGLGVIRKTFGVVLLAIAVKLFAANVKGLFI